MGAPEIFRAVALSGYDLLDILPSQKEGDSYGAQLKAS
jgi:hypothetical protein